LQEYLTKKELSQLLRVHETTVDRWRKEGMPFIKVTKKVLFDKVKVQEWLNHKSK
jgi:excisionase family DNA binding protein